MKRFLADRETSFIKGENVEKNIFSFPQMVLPREKSDYFDNIMVLFVETKNSILEDEKC